jgi:hypothetical protein
MLNAKHVPRVLVNAGVKIAPVQNTSMAFLVGVRTPSWKATIRFVPMQEGVL